MLRIAANISVLFAEWPLLARFATARRAGFDGVELQFPYEEAPHALAAASIAAAMPVVLINAPVLPGTHPLGLSGRPEMRSAFRAQLSQIRDYAQALGVRFVHILAGTVRTPEEREACLDTHVENLLWAAAALGECGVQVLIEPLNAGDAPDYLIGTLADAESVLERCGPAVGLQFDVYHIARMGLDPATELRRLLPLVRHIQVADAPGRHEPGTGQIRFDVVWDTLRDSNYRGWLAAEYRPLADTVEGLRWLERWRGGW